MILKIVLALLIAVTGAVSGCGNGGGESGSEVNAYEEFDANANLPFPMLMPDSEFTEEDRAGYQFNPGFGGEWYEKDGLGMTFAGWPDVLDGYHLIEYRLKDAAYSFFGVSVGDDITEAVEALLENGYEVVTPEDYPNQEYDLHLARLAKNGEMYIYLVTYGSNTMKEIYINAAVTNVNGVVF